MLISVLFYPILPLLPVSRLGRRSGVGQALTTEAIAECIRNGGVWEAESDIELLDLVSAPAASDWNTSLTVERINL